MQRVMSACDLRRTCRPYPGLASSRRRGSGRSVIDDIDFPMAILAYFFFLPSSSVKTTLLPHTPNDLFNQIWRKGVPFGSLVQKLVGHHFDR